MPPQPPEGGLGRHLVGSIDALGTCAYAKVFEFAVFAAKS